MTSKAIAIYDHVSIRPGPATRPERAAPADSVGGGANPAQAVQYRMRRRIVGRCPLESMRVMPPKRKPISRYAFAVLAVAVTLLVTALVRALLPDKTPFLLFFAAVAFSAGYGGLGPGILATLLSSLACWLFFVPLRAPSHELVIARTVEFALFVLVALLISSVSEVLHSARRRSEVALFLAAIATPKGQV